MGIGELAEGPLHAALKRELAGPGARFEVPVDRFVIDAVTADGTLLEIQTGNFAALGPKLDTLLDRHRIRVVHPVAVQRWVVRADAQGTVTSRRRGRSGSLLDVFDQLVSFPTLVGHPNLRLEVVAVAEDHVRATAPGTSRSGRRRRDPGVRHLVQVLEGRVLREPSDVLALVTERLPGGRLPEELTTASLAAALGTPTVLTQRIVFCLRHLELLEPAGRQGHAPLYRRPATPVP